MSDISREKLLQKHVLSPLNKTIHKQHILLVDMTFNGYPVFKGLQEAPGVHGHQRAVLDHAAAAMAPAS